jgi:hypothetical protein
MEEVPKKKKSSWMKGFVITPPNKTFLPDKKKLQPRLPMSWREV